MKWEGEKATGGSLGNIDIKCISEGAEEQCQAARRRTKSKQTKDDTIEDGEWDMARKEQTLTSNTNEKASQLKVKIVKYICQFQGHWQHR